MPDEGAFSRRQPGVNPIALELDRLAEQRALQSLGRPRGEAQYPREATAPMASDEDIAAEEARIQALRQASPDAAQWNRLSPAEQQLANAWDVAPGELNAAMQRATQPFQYEPGDPYWGGLEEDEAHELWAQRHNQLRDAYSQSNLLDLARMLASGGQ